MADAELTRDGHVAIQVGARSMLATIVAGLLVAACSSGMSASTYADVSGSFSGLITGSLPAHIILIRHAERLANPFNPHLSSAGVKRAERLVSFITTNPAMIKLGTPIAVYAAYSTKSGSGQRTLETVAPLAKSLKLIVETPELGKNYVALAKLILTNPALAGKTVLVCWNHEWIPLFAVALGVTPEPAKWDGSVYDMVYIISYHDGKATLAISRYQ